MQIGMSIQVISTTCSSNSLFLLVSGRLDMSLCRNLLFGIAHPLQWTDESLPIQSKRGLAASRSLTDQDMWKQLLEHSLVVNVRKKTSQAGHFCVCLHVPLQEVSLRFHVHVEQWVVEVGAVLLDSCVHGREGSGQRWDEGGSSSLWSHPFWLRPVSQAPKQLLLLQATCVWLSAGAAWYGLSVRYHSISLVELCVRKMVWNTQYLYMSRWKQ